MESPFVKPTSSTHYNGTVVLNLPKPVDQVSLHAVLFHSYNDVTYQQFLMDIWQDFCAYLDGKSIVSLEVFFFVLILNSNIRRCPIQPPILFHLVNYSMDEGVQFPSFLPAENIVWKSISSKDLTKSH